MARVKLERVSRKINQTIIIDNINLEIPNGEFWVLVGPSGCGKSTILRSIAGLESISEGNIYFNEKLMNDTSARHRDVAMVFQNYALYPHLTVAENMAFGLKMRGVGRALIEEKVQQVANILNISHLLQRKPKQLSGGQQQRVALGRAIIRNPQVFLLDEPLSNLDAQLREQTRTELKILHSQVNITTIYVTHDQIEAMTLGDRIVVLDQGKIQQIGTPTDVYNSPVNKMVATFLGSPPMNIIPAVFQDGQFYLGNIYPITLPSRFLASFSPHNGQSFDLGIRPEHITTTAEGAGIPLQTKIIEPLGKEILIKGLLLETDITLDFLVPSNVNIDKKEIINLVIDIEKIVIFDSITGEKIE
ncbi:MAG: ABC transporter ATP-binding protein [Cyanobacterium sp. T60_A2020_053]|nr:ABC transporter ATP-binding protein [Cyanobacterium sp. T60_A2020_053]